MLISVAEKERGTSEQGAESPESILEGSASAMECPVPSQGFYYGISIHECNIL